tara:strand:- start:216 stop:3059 length:2844 start_codon:yes stop_codon:yes gene_type:complete
VKQITLKGVKENNLKDIDIDIPRGEVTILTGISGSGKSTLAFDTIFAEGQRRYLESLSNYARQFVDRFKKPDLEYVSGLSPSVSVDQKTFMRNPRSTVATVTEIYDFIRLMFARLGTINCYECNNPVQETTLQSMLDSLTKNLQGQTIEIYFPIAMGKKGEFKNEISFVSKLFSSVRINGQIIYLNENIVLEKQKKHDIHVYVDSVKVASKNYKRLAESIETALKYGEGIVLVETELERKIFNQSLACSNCGISLPEVSPRLFSFNSPYGCCKKCDGIGQFEYFDEALIVPDLNKSIKEGAIQPIKDSQLYKKLLKDFIDKNKIKDDIPFVELSAKDRSLIFYGAYNKTISSFIKEYENEKNKFNGIINILQEWYDSSRSEETKTFLKTYQKTEPCDECKGSRLNNYALNVFIDNLNIFDICSLSVKDCYKFFQKIKFKKEKQKIWDQLQSELLSRLEFLSNVGLDYLTLNRTAPTLSGGEAQRIRLASQLGAKLTGVTYVLDEPTIGLHPRDNDMLQKSLRELKKRGNTVIVVEHDEETIRTGDYIIDIGPGAGTNGGEIVAKGMIADIVKNKLSITGQYLSGKKKVNINRSNSLNEEHLEIFGASLNNLKSIDVRIPIGKISCITGVSGSGKSSLAVDTIFKILSMSPKKLNKKIFPFVESIQGFEYFEKIINIDQSPIGRTPRSNPATYTGIYSSIREIFSSLQESRMKGFLPGRFSFNIKEGSCEECSGGGSIKIEMNFLPDVTVQCESCQGKRFDLETLKIRYKDKNIADVLDMTFEDSAIFFKGFPLLKSKIDLINSVGLGYLKIGQPATTLSGGEAQRIKLSKELIKKNTGKGLYILDEPTIGLHFSDVDKLLNVIYKLRDAGNTIIIIEHNIDIINASDYIVDLGPQGGEEGGHVIFQGSTKNFEKCLDSATAKYLKKHVNRLIRESKIRNNKAEKNHQ